MLKREVPEVLVNALVSSGFWQNVCNDPELQIEIRNGVITVYYRGSALIRELQLEDGRLVARIHCKYIPLQSPDSKSDVLLACDDHKTLGFVQEPTPLALGSCASETLKAYKRCINKVRSKISGASEFGIVHEIASHTENRILDQELTFQESGGPRDKIDICHFDQHLNCISLVEVKSINDPRLISPDTEAPEVIEQLERYRRRIEQHHAEITDACRTMVDTKRRLGLGSRLEGVQDDGLNRILVKPVLVIGGCNSSDVKDISTPEEEWEPLMTGLRQVAAGLILCGQKGCRLELRKGSQRLIFDTTIQ